MWELLKNDWEKVPQNIRYLLEIGIALIANTWILDHWLSHHRLPYLFLGYFDIRSFSYNVGQLLILISIIFVLAKQVIQLRNLPELLINYKTRYSIKDIGTKFDLVWFNGKLILFDYVLKKYYHVYPWETAQDLNFTSYGTHVIDKFPDPSNSKINIAKGKIIDVNKFTNGGTINTTVK